ncbi:MAG: hypothetical protein HYV26_12740 [Candidatus Hydrogenedentes bacterium]|nr:hypothetical protein [Candidatus Hydrogenedentota bacterium]
MFPILPAALVLLASLGAPQSKVEGKLKVNDNETALTHGLALLYDNQDEGGEAPELRLLFTDREVSALELEAPDLFAFHTLAQDGKLQGVGLNFDPKEDPREVQGTVYFTPADSMTSLPSLSMSGEEAGFKALKITAERISGQAEYESTDSEFSADDESFSYLVNFDLPILKCSPVKEKLTGPDAAKSPQAAVFLAFEKAVRDGDLETAKKLATASKFAELEMAMEQFGKEAFLAQVKMFIPEPATREAQIERVIVREKRATLVAKEEGSKTIVPLVREGEAWKVD